MKMFNYWRMPVRFTLICTACIVMIFISACGPAQEDVAEQEGLGQLVENTAVPLSTSVVEPDVQNNNATVDEPYPGAEPDLEPHPIPYPGPTIEGLQAEPPNTERDLPAADSETGTVGGILIREIVGEGFVPLTPHQLILGEIINFDNGEPAYVGTSGESPIAELFPTGIFIFRNIAPGNYNLVMDIGITQVLVGETFSVKAGQVVDLGQVIVELPD